tara:strand:- start:2296 stop:2529 length:234 start_codon:yes stop_codon:yes gene_type:complete
MSAAPTSPKNENPVVPVLLANCAKNGDEANAKLAQETLEDSKKVGMQKAMENMAQNCFKHPKTGQPLSYNEMRMFYG